MTAVHPTRRAVLKGLGACLTLPWLESLAWADDPPFDLRQPTEPPRRWASLFFANGVNVDHWWARGAGPDMQFSSSLAPLQPWREQLLVLDNLTVRPDLPNDAHYPSFTNLLSGVKVTKGTLPEAGLSLDQFLARRIGQATPLPSLCLSTEPIRPGIRLGAPSVYFHTVSWTSPTTPVPPEFSPRQAFDRLFDVSGLERDRSVLDTVAAQLGELRGRVARRDGHKLDEFAESVRSLERRIERATSDERVDRWTPTLGEPDLDRPDDRDQWDVPTHYQLMLDILALALRMDRTRIATFIFQSDASNMTFDFLDGVTNSGMHSLSHHAGDPGMLDQYHRINRYHVEQFAGFLERLHAVDEGEGRTLLDSSMVLFGSSMMDGNRHDHSHVPLILAGRGGGTLRPGRVLRYEADDQRLLCNLHLACAQRLGLAVDRFGNSTMPLPGLLG